MSEDQIAPIRLCTVDGWVVAQNICRPRADPPCFKGSTIAAGDFHLEHTRYNLAELAVAEP